MSRLEGESKDNRDLSIALAVAITVIVGTGFLIHKIGEEAKEAKRECITSGQISDQGEQLEGFLDGKGCERFLVNRQPKIYDYPHIGVW